MNEGTANGEAALKKAHNACFRLLKIRNRSEKELRDRLKQRKFTSGIISETIGYLKSIRLIDDEQFSRNWIQARLTKPFGLRRIQSELRQKGIPNELLKKELAFAEKNFDERAALKELLQKCRTKYKNVEPLKRKQRMFSYLARRGFNIEAIEEALQKS